ITYFTNEEDGQRDYYTGNNNIYARPTNDNSTFLAFGSYYTLSGWRTYTGQEANSRKSPKAISSLSQLRFEYNAENASKVINLGATYLGMDSTTYSGTITLAPFSSTVLLYQSGVIANQPPVPNAGADV